MDETQEKAFVAFTQSERVFREMHGDAAHVNAGKRGFDAGYAAALASERSRADLAEQRAKSFEDAFVKSEGGRVESDTTSRLIFGTIRKDIGVQMNDGVSIIDHIRKLKADRDHLVAECILASEIIKALLLTAKLNLTILPQITRYNALVEARAAKGGSLQS